VGLTNFNIFLCFQAKEIEPNVGIATVDFRTGTDLMTRGLNTPSGFQRECIATALK